VEKKYPSYKGLIPASKVSSKSKRANTNRNTKHELALRKELWRMGLRYRVNDKDIDGKPDIVFYKAKVLVFCDGDFWHGRNWEKLSGKLKNGANAEYWVAKIRANMERDLFITKQLEKEGWSVIRVWENEIKKDPRLVARGIYDAIKRRLGNLQE
jgi:DNA mismatch endonuclease (patch repair protein)